MTSASAWTGQTACALQDALRLSNEAFAERLGIGVRTVAGWHQKPTLRPQSEMQQLLDTALEQAPPAAKARFAALNSPDEDQEKATDAEHRLTADANISAALQWLDQAAAWEQGTARRNVAARLAEADVRQLHDRGVRRGLVGQARVAETLSAYYSRRTEPYGQYAATYGQNGRAATSILTRPDWLDLDCPLETRPRPPPLQFTSRVTRQDTASRAGCTRPTGLRRVQLGPSRHTLTQGQPRAAMDAAPSRHDDLVTVLDPIVTAWSNANIIFPMGCR
jgi:transcriptional regulator with XRE-family HTH domain